ncbi:MAG: hypothetical protein ED557_12055 [Balneola sp.]|nr:MAG: hypothetical protein ED557_12055 [Balneola sp.]
MRRMGYILLTIIFIVIGVIAYFSFTTPKHEPTVRQITFTSSTGLNVYLVEKIWGISSDHRQVVLTEVPQKDNDISNINFTYSGQLPFLYKQVKDTLFIYVQKPLEQESSFNGNIKLKQVVLNNPEMMDLLMVYEQEGLKKL